MYRGYVGGRGAGKSTVGAYDLLRRAKPGRRYMAVAPKYSAIKDITYPAFCEMAAKTGQRHKIRVTDFRGTFATQYGGEANIVFRSGDDPESLRGPNLSGAWLDEASLTTHDVYLIVIACLREGGETGWLTATFTPKGKAHWTHEIFATGKPSSFLARSRTKDNPFLSAEFVAEMEAAYGNTRLASQELSGDFIDTTGVLINWESILACQDKKGESCLWPNGSAPNGFRGDLFMGVDIGRSRHRSVITTIEKLGDVGWTREMKVMQEVPYQQQQEEIARRITRQVGKCKIDKGVQGGPLAEDLERRFPRVAEGVSLSAATQVRLAERLAASFESRRIRIPDDQMLRDDLQLVTVRKDGTVDTAYDPEVGHADRFWSLALAYDCLGDYDPPVQFSRPVSRPAVRR